MRLVVSLPDSYSTQDKVLHHIRKVGEHLCQLSQYPANWQQMSVQAQKDWISDLQNDVSIYSDVLGRLQMALYFCRAEPELNQTVPVAEEILTALHPFAETYLAIKIST